MTQNIKEACEKYVRDNNIPGEYVAYDLERFVEVFAYDGDEYEDGYSHGHDAGYDEGRESAEEDVTHFFSKGIRNIINKCVSFDELKEELLAFIDE